MLFILGIVVGVLLKSVWEVAVMRLLLTDKGMALAKKLMQDSPKGEVLSASIPASEVAAKILTKDYGERQY